MNIKQYFGFDDPAYSEYEIYNCFKHTTRWKLTVLKVRLIILLFRLFPLLFCIFDYPDELINMVIEWEG